MADIAQIGFSSDTAALKDAKADLNALIPVADKVEKSAKRVDKALTDVGSSGNVAAAGADKADAALNRAAAGANSASAAINSAAAGNVRLAEGYDVLTGKVNSNFMAISRNLHSMNQSRDSVNEVGGALKFTAREGLNFSRQFADIGVTAAMGMSPFMIAIQQGPQLFDILQEKAIAAGVSIGTVFRAAGAQIYAALAPILAIVGAIAVALAVIGVGFELGARNIRKSSGDIAEGLDLSTKQMERLKKAGVDTSVTLVDTFVAFFDVLGERLQWLFDGPLKTMKYVWNEVLDFITEFGLFAIKIIVGGFAGAVGGIIKSWRLLPAALGEIAINTANAIISALEMMINFYIKAINLAVSFANTVLAPFGVNLGNGFDDVSLGRVANQFAGAGADFAAAFAEGFLENGKAGVAAVDRFFDDVGKRATQRRTKLITDAAGDAAKTPKGPKTEAEKFADIVGGAQRDIATLNAKINAVEMTDAAAARLTATQKLLNEADQKGIHLTEAQRATLVQLGATIGDLEVKLKNLEGFKAISEGADKTLTALQQSGAQIGVYGEQLASLIALTNMYNEATAKHIELGWVEVAILKAKAAQIGVQTQANAHDQFIEDIASKGEADQFSMERERNEIKLTGAALAAYRYETDLLLQAKQKHIDLTPTEIAAIHAAAEAYGAQRKAIDDLKERMDFARETIKGFLNDMVSGLEQGKSVWQSFGDAVLNVLQKIANKLMDKIFDKIADLAINAIFNGIGGGGGGGSVTASAKGNVFTNGIVNSPTLFKFANGVGLMGEAGPEAVMPLERGPDGSLGVHMFGGSGGGKGPVNVSVVNYHTLTGAISSQDVIELNKRSAEQTKADLRRSIPDIIQQYDRDGALA